MSPVTRLGHPEDDAPSEERVCSRCGEKKPVDQYYFVSKKLGTRRGQCKPCMADIKAMQKDPNWKPACSRCGAVMDRFGPGRRICEACFEAKYDAERKRLSGSHHLRLNPCSACGVKRLLADHIRGGSLCGVCRSVPQGRRKRLRSLFNMTPRDYVELLEKQRHCCWICQRRFTKTRVPHVDHQHAEPMIVRGLLCGPCNSLLGMARDEITRLQAAAAYLQAPPAQFVFPGLVAKPDANRRGDWRPLTRVREQAA